MELTKDAIQKKVEGLHYHEILRQAGHAKVDMFSGRTQKDLQDQIVEFVMKGGELLPVNKTEERKSIRPVIRPAIKPAAKQVTSNRMERQERRQKTVAAGVDNISDVDLDYKLFKFGIFTNGSTSALLKKQIIALAEIDMAA